MERVKLTQSLDVIDYIADNNEACKGRKILTDKAMADKITALTDNVTVNGTETHLSIVCSKTGNITEVDLVRESSDCYWLKECKANDIEPIGPVDPSKSPIHITNIKPKEKN